MRYRALCLTALALLVSLPAVAQETAPAQRIHLDLDSHADLAVGWACTNWHELWPSYCAIWHLDKIEGDGRLKACNFAWFNGQRFHIDWVGPTYFLDCLGIIAEPAGDPTADELADPVGDVWHEVQPEYCTEHTVTGWDDADGSGNVSECDIVILNGSLVCHVRRVSTDVIISPAPVATTD